jgi:hypothetical protein
MRSMRGCLPAIRIGSGGWAPFDKACNVIATVDVGVTGAQQRFENLDRLLEAADTMVEREVEGVEFRLVPAAADPEDEPSAAHLVERCRHLGGDAWVANGSASTSVPSATRDVTAPNAVSIVQASWIPVLLPSRRKSR